MELRFGIYGVQARNIEAKKRGLTCGVGETASEDHNCYKDPKLCGNIILCDLATTGNPKNWNTTYNTDHTMEAKLRGLTCGVEPVSVIAENVDLNCLPVLKIQVKCLTIVMAIQILKMELLI